MSGNASIAAVEAAGFSSQFIRPLHGSYCFSGIPGFIQRLFGGGSLPLTLPSEIEAAAEGAEKVAVVFLDAFGWRFFQEYTTDRPTPQISEFFGQGTTFKLTSQFPSTTAAHVTTLHTGIPVGGSHVFEWFQAHPRVGRAIAPLLTAFAEDGSRSTLARHGIDNSDLYPKGRLYPVLSNLGVRSHVFAPAEYAFSPYNSTVCQGSEVHGYALLEDGMATFARTIAEADRCYAMFYWDKFDHSLHHHGPLSPEPRKVADYFFSVLENKVLRRIENDGKTALLFIADHGQVEVDPASTWYLDKQMPELVPLLLAGSDGQPLMPAGAGRDLFLYARPGREDELKERLSERLTDIAEVWSVPELEAHGFFGDTKLSYYPEGAFAPLVVLPYAGESVFWSGNDNRFALLCRGHHGGLTRQEMEIPFHVVRV